MYNNNSGQKKILLQGFVWRENYVLEQTFVWRENYVLEQTFLRAKPRIRENNTRILICRKFIRRSL
jgi:hypothetical protein